MDAGPSFNIGNYNKNRIKSTITIKGMVLVGVDLIEKRTTKNSLSYERKKIH